MTFWQLLLGIVVTLVGGLLLARIAYSMATQVYSNPGYVALRCFFPAAGVIALLYYDWCQPSPPHIGRLSAAPAPIVAGEPFTLTVSDLTYDEQRRTYSLSFDFKTAPPQVTFYLTDNPPTAGSQPDQSSHIGDRILGEDHDPSDGYGLRVEPGGGWSPEGPPRADLLPGRQRIAAEIYQHGQRERIVTEFEVVVGKADALP